MILCKKCKKDKPIQQIRTRKTGKTGWCTECIRTYNREYYQKNKQRITENLRKRRQADPDFHRQQRRAYYAKSGEVRRKRNRKYYEHRFFYARSIALRGPGKANYKELASIWKRQRGRCVLTGQKLNRSAEIDHKLPRSRGGLDNFENLQWLIADVNRAKRAMIDEEFVQLCRDVVTHKERDNEACSRRL